MRYLVEFRNKWGDVVRQALTTPVPIGEAWAIADQMTEQGAGLSETTALFAQVARPEDRRSGIERRIRMLPDRRSGVERRVLVSTEGRSRGVERRISMLPDRRSGVERRIG